MSFSTLSHEGLWILQAPNLAVCGLRHGFSTRRGGCSPAPFDSLNLWLRSDDTMEHVRENYRRFCSALRISPERTVCSNQVHGDTVRPVTAEDCGKGVFFPQDYEADALITQVPDVALTVFSADCCPLLFFDPVTRSIGACHAGWRGTALGIAEKTVAAMTRHFGTDPQDLQVAMGPTIGACCFETQEDVPAAMLEALGESARPFLHPQGAAWRVDLPKLNRQWLLRAGVPSENITDSGRCTRCDSELFWSHRSCGRQRGAQAAMIALAAGGLA